MLTGSPWTTTELGSAQMVGLGRVSRIESEVVVLLVSVPQFPPAVSLKAPHTCFLLIGLEFHSVHPQLPHEGSHSVPREEAGPGTARDGLTCLPGDLAAQTQPWKERSHEDTTDS